MFMYVFVTVLQVLGGFLAALAVLAGAVYVAAIIVAAIAVLVTGR